MRVNASLPSYKQIEVELNPNKTAKDLKAIICKKLGIEPELTRLLAHGKSLPDHTRLSKIKETVTIDYLWARHLLLWGLEGQKRIRDSSVLLAGRRRHRQRGIQEPSYARCRANYHRR